MNKTALTLILLAFGFQASAGTLLLMAQNGQNGKIQYARGFSDSSFNYGAQKGEAPEQKICYSGDINGVCPQISSYAAAMNRDYSRGAHDAMDLQSCEIKEKNVLVSYRLTDDYGGDLQANRTITDCNSN